MKLASFFSIFLLLCSCACAAGELVSVRYKDRVEHYWVMYTSPDGKYTKVCNAQSGIDFFMETQQLRAITIRSAGGSKGVRIRSGT